jgi:hypothetical protein
LSCFKPAGFNGSKCHVKIVARGIGKITKSNKGKPGRAFSGGEQGHQETTDWPLPKPWMENTEKSVLKVSCFFIKIYLFTSPGKAASEVF